MNYGLDSLLLSCLPVQFALCMHKYIFCQTTNSSLGEFVEGWPFVLLYTGYQMIEVKFQCVLLIIHEYICHQTTERHLALWWHHSRWCKGVWVSERSIGTFLLLPHPPPQLYSKILYLVTILAIASLWSLITSLPRPLSLVWLHAEVSLASIPEAIVHKLATLEARRTMYGVVLMCSVWHFIY